MSTAGVRRRGRPPCCSIPLPLDFFFAHFLLTNTLPAMKYFSLVFRALPAAAVVFLLAVVPFHAHAEVCDNLTGAPIDGGASLLLASGVAFAVRRVRQARLARKKAL